MRIHVPLGNEYGLDVAYLFCFKGNKKKKSASTSCHKFCYVQIFSLLSKQVEMSVSRVVEVDCLPLISKQVE